MKRIMIITFLWTTFQIGLTQSVGIGTTTPDPSAKVEVASTTQGMLVPRMTSEQRNMIASPAQGLLVFDLTSNSFWFRNSNSWVELIDSINTEVHRNGPNSIYTAMTDDVGIGTHTPYNKVDIINDGGRLGTHAAGKSLYITSENGSDGVEFRNNQGTQGIGFNQNFVYAAGSNSSHNLGFAAQGTDGSLFFVANDEERMRITGNGNVGVGIFPNNKLDIRSGNTRTGTHPTALPFYVTGNIGAASGGFEIRHYNSTQGIGLGYNTIYATGSNTDQELSLASRGMGSLNLMTNGIERFRITGTGRVGIGTSSPDHSLSVANKFGVDANGAVHLKNTPRQIYFSEDAMPNKMVLSHSPSFPTWGLQYTSSNSFRFLKDSTAVMSVNLGANNVEINGSLKIGYTRVWSDVVSVPGLTTGTATCSCPAGTVVIGGGFDYGTHYNDIVDNYPDSNTSWYVRIYNGDFGSHSLRAYAICARFAN